MRDHLMQTIKAAVELWNIETGENATEIVGVAY